jgi:membrane fusion protein, macrolide-specific efflux system
MDGTVVAQTTLAGQTVNASQSAPVIVRIANLEVMTVWAQVAEADVGKIVPGMPAYFSTLGLPERRWRGTVRQVQPTPKTDNDVVLYNVLIDVDNREQLLLPSMTVQAFFLLGEARDVPVVPLAALARDRSGYQATVLTESGPEQRRVEVGLTNRTSAQIVSGLEPGDRIVLPQAPPETATPQRRERPLPGPRL